MLYAGGSEVPSNGVPTCVRYGVCNSGSYLSSYLNVRAVMG